MKKTVFVITAAVLALTLCCCAPASDPGTDPALAAADSFVYPQDNLCGNFELVSYDELQAAPDLSCYSALSTLEAFETAVGFSLKKYDTALTVTGRKLSSKSYWEEVSGTKETDFGTFNCVDVFQYTLTRFYVETVVSGEGVSPGDIISVVEMYSFNPDDGLVYIDSPGMAQPMYEGETYLLFLGSADGCAKVRMYTVADSYGVVAALAVDGYSTGADPSAKNEKIAYFQWNDVAAEVIAKYIGK